MLFKFTDPCHYYNELSERGRKTTFGVISSPPKCDNHLPDKKTWYRFIEPAGTQMPTSCVPKRRCNTHAPGWLNGRHPNVTQGVVNMKVCFHSGEDCCYYHQFISVKNCSSFYSYGLVKPPKCKLRYCGEY